MRRCYKKINKKDKIVLYSLFLILIYLLACFVHAIPYSNPDYVCTHMSRDLEDFIEFFGFDVKLLIGGDPTGSRHCWIKIGAVEFDSVYPVPCFNSLIYTVDADEFDDYKDYAKTRYTPDKYNELLMKGEL